MTQEPMTDEYGVGFVGDEYAGTTVSRERLAELAGLFTMGPDPEAEYRYRQPRSDDDPDDTPFRPCNYPLSLDSALRGQLREACTWDQARAMVAMKCCQIVQTGTKGRNQLADADERGWAVEMYAASRAEGQLHRVPGTCIGCNSDPCRCLA